MIDWAEEGGAPRALLVGVADGDVGEVEAASLVDELRGLCASLGVEVAETMTVKLRERNPKLLVGSGKAEEIKARAEALGAGWIVFDRGMSPTQQRNWEKLSSLEVYDRQEVILLIFAERARSREAVLQVELARLKYSLPRLTHSYGALSRQRGGAKGNKGAGETQLELDKRRIQARIRDIEDELEGVVAERATRRKKRDKDPLPSVALVGYTNAGKSSMLNALSGSDAYVEDQLFATLDPTTRKVERPGGRSFLLSDTVGFVRNLPHDLVEAFRSTLEEAVGADLLVNVVDAADPEAEAHHATTRKVLDDLGAGDKREVVVLNKADLAGEGRLAALALAFPGAIRASAKGGEGLEDLLAAIDGALAGEVRAARYRVPHARGDLVARAHRTGQVLSEAYGDEAVELEVVLPERERAAFAEFLVGGSGGGGVGADEELQ